MFTLFNTKVTYILLWLVWLLYSHFKYIYATEQGTLVRKRDFKCKLCYSLIDNDSDSSEGFPLNLQRRISPVGIDGTLKN